MPEDGAKLIIRKFHGLWDTGRSKPDPQRLASLPEYTTEAVVIRDQGGFQRFVDQVPKREMSHVQNPAPSDDPILQRPGIEFGTHMVLAIIAHDVNRFIELDIEGVELASGTMRVRCRETDPRRVVQKIISYGTYCAVIVRRFDGEVVFIHQRRRAARRRRR